jgi:hypothetical protein
MMGPPYYFIKIIPITFNFADNTGASLLLLVILCYDTGWFREYAVY